METATARGDLHGLLIADSVVEPLVRVLADVAPAPVIRLRTAPYNQVLPVLLTPDRPEWQGPDLTFALVWTAPERVSPDLCAAASHLPFSAETVMADVDRLAEAICATAARLPWVLVTTWALPIYRRWVQGLTWRHKQGLANLVQHMNLRLAERVADAHNVVLLDVSFWRGLCSSPPFDPKLHFLAKIEGSREFFHVAAQEIKAVLRAASGDSRKLVICDLDNTLWGGIIGDDGMAGVRLGGHDPVGEAYAAVQQELLALKRRGILLAVCSKNDEAVALEMLRQHPCMLLGPDDFAARRINWQDKAQNIAAILTELNLLPGAAVFLDDSPAERDRVRQAFPDILVPDLPADLARYPSFIASLNCFEALTISPEDLNRSRMYEAEQQRQLARAGTGSVEEWLSTLDLRVTVRPLTADHLPRAVQLLNKTNQFNMATRRLSDSEFWNWATADRRHALLFTARDRFGDYGMIGMLTAEVAGDRHAELIDFVMSCRVMSKGIEEAMLHAMLVRLGGEGAAPVSAVCRQTPKNRPFAEYLATKLSAPGSMLLAPDTVALPPHITLNWEPIIT